MYTKDKWYVEEDEMEEMSILTIPEGEDSPDTIATVRLVGNFDGKEMMANAHLIAAAPRMAKFLENLCAEFEDYGKIDESFYYTARGILTAIKVEVK